MYILAYTLAGRGDVTKEGDRNEKGVIQKVDNSEFLPFLSDVAYLMPFSCM